MSVAVDFLSDALGAFRVMPAGQAMRWLGNIALNAPAILGSRKLYAADQAMSGTVRFCWGAHLFSYDIDAHKAEGGIPFAFMRELFVRGIYFRAFNPEKLSFAICLDLGCNMGIVSDTLNQIENGQIVALDAQSFATSPFRQALVRRGGISFEHALLVGPKSDPVRTAALMRELDASTTVTMPQLLERHRIDRISFLKCDVEGAEFDVFERGAAWLKIVDNIAMEVHRHVASPTLITDALLDAGFDVMTTTNHGTRVSSDRADYVYASRNGALIATTLRSSKQPSSSSPQ